MSLNEEVDASGGVLVGAGVRDEEARLLLQVRLLEEVNASIQLPLEEFS